MMPTITKKWTVLGIILFLNHQASCEHGGCTVPRATVSPYNIQWTLTLLGALESTRHLCHRVFKSNVMNVEISSSFCGWTYFHQRFLLLRLPPHEWESSCGCVAAGKEAELLTKCWARPNSLKLTWI